MATINYDDGSVYTVGTGLTTNVPGAARSSKMLANTGRVSKIVTGSFTFDASYPTGGEDVSDLFSRFAGATALAVIVDPSVPLTSAGTGKRVKVDYTNKKFMLYDNAVSSAEVSNGTDQSGAAGVRFIAVGYA